MKYKRWFALALALCLALALSGCGFGLAPFREVVRGSGVVATREVALPDGPISLRLDEVSFQFPSRNVNSIDLTVVVDESLDRVAVLETDNNILSRIAFAYDSASGQITLNAPRTMLFSPTKMALTVGAPVREITIDGLWNIHYNCPSVKAFQLTDDGTANGDFTFGELDSLVLRFGGLSTIDLRSGGVKECRLTADGTLNGDFAFGEMGSLDMRFGGLSTIHLRSAGVKDCRLAVDGSLNGDFVFGEMDSLNMNLSGLSNIGVRGAAQRAVFKLDGGGDISALDLIAQDASVTISGLGSCDITAEQSLNAVIEGGGRITYAGSPAVTQRVDGLGSIRAK